MKKRNWLILASLLLMTVNVAFAKMDEDKTIPIYTESKQNILVTESQPEFTYQLKSNPTTGYSWFLREYDASLITPVKHSFQAPEKKLIGAPGYELWTFRVKPAAFHVPQQTNIRLIYMRPWQSDDSATQIRLNVTTQGK